jgi:uncharacterized protein YaiE (UPF0345 family)
MSISTGKSRACRCKPRRAEQQSGYAFSTSTEERMVVTSGILTVKMPGVEWKEIPAGKEFIVAANQTFEVEAKQDASYICYYK